MAKSRNKNGSEVQFLRGKIRKLQAELKYYKKREHFFDKSEEFVDEPEESEASKCPLCKSGAIIVFDFHHAVLKKCSECVYEQREKKKKDHKSFDEDV